VKKPKDHKLVPEVWIFGFPFFLVIQLDRGGFQVNNRGQYGNQRLHQNEVGVWQQGR